MPHIIVGKENSMHVELYYEDHGTGKPIILIAGWPLSSKSWEKQIPALVAAGQRVITYDRRGFGESSRPNTGYDYDTLTGDLRRLLLELDILDATLVGFSMGGGEVARYCGQYGSERVSRAVFIDAVTPFLKKTADNPDGVDPGVFDEMIAAIAADRPAFLSTFLATFFNADTLKGTRISDSAMAYHWNDAVNSSAVGTRELVDAWSGTDFRGDLARIDVPTLVVHGDADRTVPLAVSGKRTQLAIRGSRLVVINGAPHGLAWTHADELNAALIDFVTDGATVATSAAGHR